VQTTGDGVAGAGEQGRAGHVDDPVGDRLGTALDDLLLFAVAAEDVAGDHLTDRHQGQAVVLAHAPGDATRLAFGRGQADQVTGGGFQLAGDRTEGVGRLVEIAAELA
jgi:hypothetical protein